MPLIKNSKQKLPIIGSLVLIGNPIIEENQYLFHIDNISHLPPEEEKKKTYDHGNLRS